MSVPATARPLFPNFSQLGTGLPPWLWALLRYLALGVALALAALLLQRPTLGLTVFWGLAVPVLPLVFLCAPGVWRNVCPLATSNQLPRRLGLDMGLTRRSLTQGLAYPLGLAALLGFIILRKQLFNHSGAATAVLVVGAMLAAFVGGVLFKGKSGWCSSICPLLPVQRMLGQTAFVQIANTQCQPCVSCTKNCYDYNPGLATLADVHDDDPRYASYRRFFAMLFPGLVLGFYNVADNVAASQVPALVTELLGIELPLSVWISVAMLGSMAASLLLFALVDAVVGPRRLRNTVPLLAALLGLNCYYWHAAPLVAGNLGRLAVLLEQDSPLAQRAMQVGEISSTSHLWDITRHAWQGGYPADGLGLAVYAVRALVLLISVWWLVRSLRAERAFVTERQGGGAAVIDTSRLRAGARFVRPDAEPEAEPDDAAESGPPSAFARPPAGGDTLPQALVDEYDGETIPQDLIDEHQARRAAAADGRTWSSSTFGYLAQSRFAPWDDNAEGRPTGFGQTGFGQTGFGQTGFGQTGFGNTGFGSARSAGLDDAAPAPPARPVAAALAPDKPALLIAPEGRRAPIRIGQTLLEALESCGAPIHPGCRAGSCGADAVAIHDGSACLGSMSDDERATLARLGHGGDSGVRLACVARLRKAGPVTVEVLPNTRMAAPAVSPTAGAPARIAFDYDRKIRRVLIVGNGVAGLTAAETVRANHPDCEIHIVSRERQPAYQRVALTRLFQTTTDPAKLSLKSDDWYLEQRIHCWLNTRVASIDTKEQILTVATTNEELPYDRLILATGASAWAPNIDGFGMLGSFVLRQASDALALRNYVHRYSARSAVVLGAGLLGIEAADALAQMKLKVQLFMSGDHLLERQVDREAGAMVADHLRQRGITVVANAAVTGVPRSAIKRVSHLNIRRGKDQDDVVEADLLLVCTGTRPDIALAKAAGLAVDQGILVDLRMRSTDPHVYACGDVAQTTAPMWGLWSPAAEQGRVAALNALGQEARYEPREPVTTLKLPGLSVRSAGKTQARGSAQMELIHRQAAVPARPGEPRESARYTKIITQRDEDDIELVIGAIVVGDDPDGDDILAAACNHTPTRKLGEVLTRRPWQRQRGQRGDLGAPAQGARALAGPPAEQVQALPLPLAGPSPSGAPGASPRVASAPFGATPPAWSATSAPMPASTRPQIATPTVPSVSSVPSVPPPVQPVAPVKPVAPLPALQPPPPHPSMPSAPAAPSAAAARMNQHPAVAMPPVMAPAVAAARALRASVPPVPSSPPLRPVRAGDVFPATLREAGVLASDGARPRPVAPASAPASATASAPASAPAPGRAAALAPSAATHQHANAARSGDAGHSGDSEQDDAEQDARRDAALDAALEADLRALGAGSRFGSLDPLQYGALDQSRFGGLDDLKR